MSDFKVIHAHELPWTPALEKGPFANRRKGLGSGKLGCGMWELPPGKKSFPLHAHALTEEALYVLSGQATLRSPGGEQALGPGDFVAFPAGGPAHQLINGGTEPFVYLAMSASVGMDLVDYPDSGKVAMSVGTGKDARRFVFKSKDQADYFDGEL